MSHDPKDSTLQAKCRQPNCGHVWIVAYLPMPMDKAAALAKHAACPKCGDTKPRVAAAKERV